MSAVTPQLPPARDDPAFWDWVGDALKDKDRISSSEESTDPVISVDGFWFKYSLYQQKQDVSEINLHGSRFNITPFSTVRILEGYIDPMWVSDPPKSHVDVVVAAPATSTFLSGRWFVDEIVDNIENKPPYLKLSCQV